MPNSTHALRAPSTAGHTKTDKINQHAKQRGATDGYLHGYTSLAPARHATRTFFLCMTVPVPRRLCGVTLCGDSGLAAGAGAGDGWTAFVAGLSAPTPPPLPVLLAVAAEEVPAAADPCPPCESAGAFPPSPCPEPRRPSPAGAAVPAPAPAPPLALFSNAAARAEALGREEAPMMAAALPVAALVEATGAVEAETGRW